MGKHIQTITKKTKNSGTLNDLKWDLEAWKDCGYRSIEFTTDVSRMRRLAQKDARLRQKMKQAFIDGYQPEQMGIIVIQKSSISIHRDPQYMICPYEWVEELRAISDKKPEEIKAEQRLIRDMDQYEHMPLGQKFTWDNDGTCAVDIEDDGEDYESDDAVADFLDTL